MKKLLFAMVFLLLASSNAKAADSLSHPLIVSFYNNATLLPGAAEWGIWSVPLHPGLSIGTEFAYQHKANHSWLQTVNLGYHYHQYALHSLQLYSEGVYRYHFNNPFDAEAKLGLGYLHAIPDAQLFELQDNGVYGAKQNWGRPQAMASLAIGFGYTFAGKKPLRAFITYRFYIQTPFVNEYVPVLPNTALHLGVSAPLLPK